MVWTSVKERLKNAAGFNISWRASSAIETRVVGALVVDVSCMYSSDGNRLVVAGSAWSVA
jgi:hypothetical protein